MASALNPYLNFSGNCEEAFNFYKSVFGGEFLVVMRFSDSPPEYAPAEHEKNKVMHVALPIGKGSILMGSDVPEHMGGTVTNGTNFAIAITADSEADADKLYSSLSAGGNASMPMAKQFWGSYFGMLTDKFGVSWMVSYDPQRG
ncbi:VOC family protein [Chitinophaga varians]|uniref:VOC family protein n=1 Tax=Chitinophaga varians TaxID=2202339 RepID=A0A847S026_9BACT|nr:VOC family protein [Chitinophaga varians]NLR66478.1 VOC family protein [Chitinophaga varians]